MKMVLYEYFLSQFRLSNPKCLKTKSLTTSLVGILIYFHG